MIQVVLVALIPVWGKILLLLLCWRRRKNRKWQIKWRRERKSCIQFHIIQLGWGFSFFCVCVSCWDTPVIEFIFVVIPNFYVFCPLLSSIVEKFRVCLVFQKEMQRKQRETRTKNHPHPHVNDLLPILHHRNQPPDTHKLNLMSIIHANMQETSVILLNRSYHNLVSNYTEQTNTQKVPIYYYYRHQTCIHISSIKQQQQLLLPTNK